MKTITNPDKFVQNWKDKFYPYKGKDGNWGKLKWHVCKKGEAVNPILFSKGGEIQVEVFGIIGWLRKRKDKTFLKKKRYFYQCPLIEARKKGTGKFGEGLKIVQEFSWASF